MHILFVDDTKDTRDLFSYFLELKGFRTQTAENGYEALTAIQQSPEPFNAIVLDVEMPVMNGWEALKAIRQIPQCQHIPILMFTGYGNGELKLRAAKEGANGLLHKPLLPHELVQAVAEVCAIKRGTLD